MKKKSYKFARKEIQDILKKTKKNFFIKMKILPTIGPITQDTSKLKTIFKYSKIVRLNASHNEIGWHKKIL